MGWLFDFTDGDMAMKMSDDVAMDSDGNMMMKMSDDMAMDMETGELHITSSSDDDD